MTHICVYSAAKNKNFVTGIAEKGDFVFMKKKQWMSLLLAVAMAVSVLPVGGAFADETETAAADGQPVIAAGQPEEPAPETPAAQTEVVTQTEAEEQTEAVALVNGEACESLEAAVEKISALAQAGTAVTVVLQQDVNVGSGLAIGKGWNVTLDLNGCRVTVPEAVNGKSAYAINNSGTLTVCDTSAEKAGVIASRGVSNAGTLYLHSGTIQCIDSNGGGAAVWNEGYFEMDGGRLEFTGEKLGDSAGSPLTFTKSGTGLVTGGEIVSPYTCIFVQQNARAEIRNVTLTSSTNYWMTVKVMNQAVCTMENVTINTINGGCVEVSGGTLNVKDCTFTQTVLGDPAWNSCALAVSNGGTITVDGGSYSGAAAAAYIYNSGGTINLNSGEFSGEKSVLKADSTTNSWGSNIVVNGGEFKGGYSIGASNASLTVFGGTFDHKLENKYLGEGYSLLQNEDNTWTVAPPVASVNGVNYSSLAEAVAAAGNGETVKILTDVCVKEQITLIDKNVTLDTNGYTVTYSGDDSHKSAVIDICGTSQVVVTGGGAFTADDDYMEYNSIGYIFRLYDNSKLTIENGDYYAGLTCVQAGDSSSAYINGGNFSASAEWNGVYWLLNLIDNTDAQIVVYAGTFKNYNPAESKTENPVANFCAPGCIVTSEKKGDDVYYTVSKYVAPTPTPDQGGGEPEATPAPTATPVPVPTATPVPAATARPVPSATPAPTEAPVVTDGAVVATTTADAVVENATAVVTIEDEQLAEAVETALSEAEAAGAAPVVQVEVNRMEGAEAVEVTLPADALTALAARDDAELVVTSEVAQITFDSAALSAITQQADGKIVLAVSPVAHALLNEAQAAAAGEFPVVELTLRSGDAVISDFSAGTATVTLPYALADGQQAEGVVVWYVDDNGGTTPCDTSYNEAEGLVTFTTPHFSRYAIAYDETLVPAAPVEQPMVTEPAPETDKAGLPVMPMAIGAIVVVLLVLVVVLRLLFKRRDDEQGY